MSEPLHAFNVAVVGPKDVMPEDELIQLLDLLVNRHIGSRRISLLSPSGGPAHQWAVDRGYMELLVPECGNAVRQDCELVCQADAVVILGSPAPWDRLIRLCREAKIPVRIYRERPHIPKQPPQAWQVS